MEDCWAEDETARPTFQEIVNRLSSMRLDEVGHSVPENKGKLPRSAAGPAIGGSPHNRSNQPNGSPAHVNPPPAQYSPPTAADSDQEDGGDGGGGGSIQ